MFRFSPKKDKMQEKKLEKPFSFLFYQIFAVDLILFKKLHEKQTAPKPSWTSPKVNCNTKRGPFPSVSVLKKKILPKYKETKDAAMAARTSTLHFWCLQYSKSV